MQLVEASEEKNWHTYKYEYVGQIYHTMCKKRNRSMKR